MNAIKKCVHVNKCKCALIQKTPNICMIIFVRIRQLTQTKVMMCELRNLVERIFMCLIDSYIQSYQTMLLLL